MARQLAGRYIYPLVCHAGLPYSSYTVSRTLAFNKFSKFLVKELKVFKRGTAFFGTQKTPRY